MNKFTAANATLLVAWILLDTIPMIVFPEHLDVRIVAWIPAVAIAIHLALGILYLSVDRSLE
jgi:hypothetical protein